MIVWRLCRARHATFDGQGAARHGGRWNHPGTSVVYTSATLSLATLELLVHVEPATTPGDLVAIPVTVPERLALHTIGDADLPAHWRGHPAPQRLADLGTAWAAGRSTAVLCVPSAVVPGERNYLLNPLHPEFRAIRVGRPERFVLDERFVRRPRARGG